MWKMDLSAYKHDILKPHIFLETLFYYSWSQSRNHSPVTTTSITNGSKEQRKLEAAGCRGQGCLPGMAEPLQVCCSVLKLWTCPGKKNEWYPVAWFQAAFLLLASRINHQNKAYMNCLNGRDKNCHRTQLCNFFKLLYVYFKKTPLSLHTPGHLR